MKKWSTIFLILKFQILLNWIWRSQKNLTVFKYEWKWEKGVNNVKRWLSLAVLGHWMPNSQSMARPHSWQKHPITKILSGVWSWRGVIMRNSRRYIASSHSFIVYIFQGIQAVRSWRGWGHLRGGAQHCD